MEAVIFMGIQATGKSSFFKHRFADSHVRINLDMLKTRYREKRLIECCLEIQQPFVIDNTNLSRKDRARYIPKFGEASVPVSGYYFSSTLDDALRRNRERKNAIPELGILSAYKTLELPSFEEGFSKLFYVKIVQGQFEILNWEG